MNETIVMFMATITLKVNVEERLIELGVARRKWASFVNEVLLDVLEKRVKELKKKANEEETRR